MPGPIFQATPWPRHFHEGVEYSLDHLNEYVVEIEDTSGARRRIVITFSDHVFTREPESTDDPAAVFPGSTRTPPGYFCTIRYQHSIRIRKLIEWSMHGIAWNLGGGNESYAQIPTIDDCGQPLLYAIVFSLDRVTGKAVDLHMRVRSAYPCDRKVPATFGSVKFKHLVTLRIQGKRPKQITSARRKKPGIGKIHKAPTSES